MCSLGCKDLTTYSGLGQIGDAVTDAIRDVEQELDNLCRSTVSVAENVRLHTLESGGKRLRPVFVSLGAQATGLPFDRRRVIRLGACMEMIHMATLIHDDVIDNSPLRRGKPTASATFGAAESVLAGDGLLAKAMMVLAEDGDLNIVHKVASAVAEMADGEVFELATRNNFDLTEEEHLRVLRMKTAAFIESCPVIGGKVAGASPEVEEALRLYGHNIGMAFQIVDDLLDYHGTEDQTGKARAVDFREGCATLPLIYLRPLLSDQEREVARLKFGNGVMDDELAMIGEWMRSRGASDQAREKANSYLNEALAALVGVPDPKTRTLMERLAHFIVDRKA
jgi:octaprenyl-diphosphate synthase